MTFIRSLFSLESVDYSSVKSLANDMVTLAKETATKMDSTSDQYHGTDLDAVNSL